MNSEFFDRESALPGPVAFRRAVDQEYAFARERGVFPGLAILQVAQPLAMVAEAIGKTFKAHRSHFDAAGRIDARTFGVVIGVPTSTRDLIWTPGEHVTLRPFGVKRTLITNALQLLEAAAEAASSNGSGNVKARVNWLRADHVSSDDWYRGATRWDV